VFCELPRKGQVSLTIAAENYRFGRDYFESNKSQLARRGITSLPVLYQTALLSFIGRSEEPPARRSLRADLIQGLMGILYANIFQSNYTLSLSYILNQSLSLIPQSRVQSLLVQQFRSREQQFLKLKEELEGLLKLNELSGDQEKRLENIVNEIVGLVEEYLRFLVENFKEAGNASEENKKRLINLIQGFYARYATLVMPYLTIILTLTKNESQLYALSVQLDPQSDSLARVVSSLSQ
jgi:hypothetical protein